MSDAFDVDYGDDAGLGMEGPTTEQLALVVRLAQEQARLERELIDLDNKLKDRQALLRTISEKELPTALLEAGMKNFTLTDGSKVELDTKVVGYVKKEDQGKVYDWFEETGKGSLIKRTVAMQFGKGESDLAEDIVNRIHEMLPKRVINNDRSIHHQTLQAFVREHYKSGGVFPEQLVVTELRKAVVTPAEKDDLL